MSHSRSRSMPSELHPIATRMESELKALTWARPPPSSSPTSAPAAACSALAALQRLHGCAGELLRLPLAQQAFARRRREKWVADELDGSIRLLDLSAAALDLLASMKEQVRDLESAARRRGDRRRGVEKKSAAGADLLQLIRRRSQRDVRKCLAVLRSIVLASSAAATPSPEQSNPELSALVGLLSQARAATATVMGSVLSLVTATPKPRARPGKRSLVSRLMGRGGWKVASEEGHQQGRPGMLSESADVDNLLSGIFYGGVSVVAGGEETSVPERKVLVMMEARIEEVAAGLERLFRQLIQNRVALLNALSP